MVILCLVVASRFDKSVPRTRHVDLKKVSQLPEVPVETLEDPGAEGVRHGVECFLKRSWLEHCSNDVVAVAGLPEGGNTVLATLQLVSLNLKQMCDGARNLINGLLN